MEQRPAAVFPLVAADEGGEAGLDLRVDLVQEMLEKDMLGRNGCVGFQRKDPVSVGMLELNKRPCGGLNRLVQVGHRNGRV